MAERGYLLLHGAMLGGWIWDRVVPLLDGQALAVDLPGRDDTRVDRTRITLAEVVDAVATEADRVPDERLVLVAHSLGGILVPGLVSRLRERVAHVVFIGSIVPVPGRSYIDILPVWDRVFFRLILRLQKRGPRAPAWAARRALCNDLDEATTTMVAGRITPELPRLYTDPVLEALPENVSTVYVTLLQDRAISASLRRASIDRLRGGRVVELNSGHLPMLGEPVRVAEVLNGTGRG